MYQIVKFGVTWPKIFEKWKIFSWAKEKLL